MKKDIIRLHQSSVEHSIRNKTNPGRFSSAEATARHLSGKVMLALQITAAAAAAGERTLLFSQAISPDLPK